ncbi:MAG TPA: F0F1 ATP synthase subunit alpha [Trueperaceae bacterium]|nr:F0F1 ATP synthase subunit alpha [Trueperaceae bacterium]
MTPHEPSAGRRDDALPEKRVDEALGDGLAAIDAARMRTPMSLRLDEVGTVVAVSQGVASVRGLPGVSAGETVALGSGGLGLVSDLREEDVGVVVLSGTGTVAAGQTVRRTGAVLDVPVGDGLLGRVVNALGEPLDARGDLASTSRLPIERPATPIVDRAPVSVPLQTGVKVVDALFPIGRGQRELIVGDRQTGKTALALTAILAQRATEVLCVYCSIGRRGAEVAQIVASLRSAGALSYTTVVVAPAGAEPGLMQITPFAAMSIAEAWMEAGKQVLVVLDDLVQHARAHREVSLLLRRPPGREAYPGDVFYLHARLLERATQLKQERGGGSLTVLPIVETQERNLAAYIPTNLISITDGQIVLSPDLFRRGQLPAVDVGLSVSRVGGKAQLPAYRSVAGGVRLSYAQFEELEEFARLGADLDESTRSTLVRGRRVRSVLMQGALQTVSVGRQLITLLAVNEGLFDALPVERLGTVEAALDREARVRMPEAVAGVESGEPLSETDREALLDVARLVVAREGTGS